MPNVLCSAVVDVITPASPRGLGSFRVEVWGKAPHDYVRIYTFQAKNENVAAQMGLNKFQEDIAALVEKED